MKPAYFNQETDRFYFRKMTIEDVEIWSDFFRNNERLEFLGLDTSESPQQLAFNWIQKQLNRYQESGLGHLAVFNKENNEFIGVAGVLPRNIQGEDRYEIAYSILPKYWGQGYATEISKQIKEFAQQHLEIDELISIIHLRNTESAKVAIKNDGVIWKRIEYKELPVHIYRYQNKNKTKAL